MTRWTRQCVHVSCARNEAVLKALFKYKEEELTFAKAITVAMKTEEAAKVAKETMYGTKTSPVHKVDQREDLSLQTRRETLHTMPEAKREISQ